MKILRAFHCPAAWPPLPLVVIFLLIYGTVTGGFWLVQLGQGISARESAASPEIMKIQMVLLTGAGMFFALHRLYRFHPACNRGYATWLGLSPWNAGKPLPLGPVHPVWQDAAVIGCLAAMAQWLAHGGPAMPVAAFGITYLIAMTLLLAYTRSWQAVLALGFLWPALMLPGMESGPGYFVFGALILAVWFGYRRGVQTFPWLFLNNSNPLNNMPPGQINLVIPGLKIEPAYLGWPYRMLSPQFARQSISTQTSICIGVLVWWWGYCILRLPEMEADTGGMLVFAVIIAIIRTAVYCGMAAPSFNVWGRLAAGRIILPGYDQVFLTPLALVAISIAGGIIVGHSGSWFPVTESGIYGLLCFVVFAGGPGLQLWMLTAPVKFSPPNSSRAKNQRLRRV